MPWHFELVEEVGEAGDQRLIHQLNGHHIFKLLPDAAEIFH